MRGRGALNLYVNRADRVDLVPRNMQRAVGSNGFSWLRPMRAILMA